MSNRIHHLSTISLHKWYCLSKEDMNVKVFGKTAKWSIQARKASFLLAQRGFYCTFHKRLLQKREVNSVTKHPLLWEILQPHNHFMWVKYYFPICKWRKKSDNLGKLIRSVWPQSLDSSYWVTLWYVLPKLNHRVCRTKLKFT